MALGNESSSFLTCYIDDILITSTDFESHLKHLNQIFGRLMKHNFTIRLSKSLFGQESVLFLGFEISSLGVRPDPKKLEVIRNFPTPNNKRQLQGFLGSCNFYRQFCLKYSNYVTPLRELLEDNAIWSWTDIHTKAFQDIKDNFINCVTLSHFLPNRMFKVQTDASDLGISGILYQEDDEKNQRIVALVSRCLSKVEIRYNTTEKELLAIVYSITKFRIYLIGSAFELITDHKALTFLNSTEFQNARLMRWSMILQEYTFTIKHCKGVDNIVADFYSRNIDGKEAKIESSKLIIPSINKALIASLKVEVNKVEKCEIQLDQILAKNLKNLEKLQKEDTHIADLIKKYQNDPNQNMYKIHENVLFHKTEQEENWRIVVPISLRDLLVKTIHEKLGHTGTYKTFRYINTHFYWRNMREFIKKCLQTCDLCQGVKVLNYSMQGEYQRVAAKKPNELVTIDFYGPLPKSTAGIQFLLVAIDAFSKYVRLYPMKRATTKVALNKMINDYFIKVGKPEKLLSDHGTQFTAAK